MTISISKFLQDELEAARKNLELAEGLGATNMPHETYIRLLTDARARLGTVAQIESAYARQVDDFHAEMESLNEAMKPVRIEAFAKERVDFYKKMAYTAVSAIEEAVGLLDKRKTAAAYEHLQKALEERNQMSRGQRGPAPITAAPTSEWLNPDGTTKARCSGNSFRSKSVKTPYGPGGYNQCIYPSGHKGHHKDDFGNVFQMSPFKVIRTEDQKSDQRNSTDPGLLPGAGLITGPFTNGVNQ